MAWKDYLKMQLRLDERVCRKPYLDTKGKITIGIGRNLSDDGLSEDEVDFLFSNDVDEAVLAARACFPGFDSLIDTRKVVLCNMAFNLGQHGLSEFHVMLKAMADGRWSDAANAMLNSVYAQEVGARAVRLANLMRG